MQNTNFCLYPISAGPGDRVLLTFKAARLLATAEMLIHEHLLGNGVRKPIPASAHRLYGGNQSGRDSLPQEGICRRLLEAGRRGGGAVGDKGSRVAPDWVALAGESGATTDTAAGTP